MSLESVIIHRGDIMLSDKDKEFLKAGCKLICKNLSEISPEVSNRDKINSIVRGFFVADSTSSQLGRELTPTEREEVEEYLKICLTD